jgi:DnaJ-domain-containing protein 1
VSQIFDRLGNLIRSAFSEDPDKFDFSRTNSNLDPDMQAAWDELNDFLNEDDFNDSYSGSNAGSRTKASSSVPSELLADYKTLEVSPGTPLAEVKISYKKLAIKYHPDKFANNPEKLKKATEMMKKLNMAYQNIKQYEKSKAS